jgi:hypothetical protein
MERGAHMSKHHDDRISPELVVRMNQLAHYLDLFFNGAAMMENPKYGFVLGVFEFNNDINGRFNYISNAKRPDMVALMKEMVKRFEGQPEKPEKPVENA